MSICESVATAIRYDRLAKTHLQATNRRRDKNFGFAAFPKKENQDPKRKAISENVISYVHPTNVKGKRKGGKGGKGKKGDKGKPARENTTAQRYVAASVTNPRRSFSIATAQRRVASKS